MTLLELPALDTTRCTNCGDCVNVCPTECLEFAARNPWLARPRDCIACTACALACNVGAVSLVAVEVRG